jgi:lysozyme family protein
MARSYQGWGAGLDDGRLGAVVVLSRGGDASLGHVGFLLGEDDDHVFLLGGNQSDAVTVTAFPKARIVGLRWPREIATPSTPAPAPIGPADAALFARSLDHVLEMEGGFSDDAYDPGGPTNLGITLAVYADWKGVAPDAALKEELQSISTATAGAIYAARYWTPAGCDDLPPALAFFHFDTAVNHGVTGAIRLLQQAVGTDIDGEMGPLTLAAAVRAPIAETLQAYAEVRRARYRALPHFWRFGRGWLARVDTTLSRALALAAEQSSTTVAAPKPLSAPQKGPPVMTDATPAPAPTDSKWWGQSMTIWGAIITTLSTVLPVLGPALGIDITADLVREVGAEVVQTVQAVGGLVGTILTIYGRARASQPLAQRAMSLKI